MGGDFETAADILLEIKEKAGIPAEQMITRFPMCMIWGKEYRTLIELAAELKISAAAISTYKNRNGCGEFWKHSARCRRKRGKPIFWMAGQSHIRSSCRWDILRHRIRQSRKRKFRYTHSLQGMILLQAVSMSQKFMRRSSRKDWNRKKGCRRTCKAVLILEMEWVLSFFMEKGRRQIGCRDFFATVQDCSY